MSSVLHENSCNEIKAFYGHQMRRGFTLVELSIVLVIIGLLVGGILAAQSMTQTAKIQRLVTDLQQYEVSITNFKVNFENYPGDSSSFIPPGDESGSIGFGTAGFNVACALAPNNTDSNYEYFQVFAQLSQAGMISTKYVPYSPVSCGGSTDDFVLNHQNLAGVTLPYTDLDSKASTSGDSKALFIPGQVVNGNFYLGIIVNAWYVMPIEAKLGYTPKTDTTIGVTSLDPLNVCRTVQNYTVGCTDKTAAFGYLYYYINPI